MAVKIAWTDFAKKQLRSIFDYYMHHVDAKTAGKLVQGIRKIQ
jgi:plasmid stabilization system protein ParE